MAMIKYMLIVGAGSFVGGALRYLFSTFVSSAAGGNFPWGTLAVNVTGCFLFGVIYAAFARYAQVPSAAYLLLATGVMGGFTTFSAFSHEAVLMLQNGCVWAFAAYVALSVIGGLLAVAVGYCVVSLMPDCRFL